MSFSIYSGGTISNGTNRMYGVSEGGNMSRRRWPPWAIGGFTGAGIWSLVFVAHPILRFLERQFDFFARWLPAWLMRMGWFGLDIDYLQEYVERGTSPLSGEWLAVDAVLGLCLYIVTGAALFSAFSMAWGRRFSLRMLLIVMTLLALLIGLAVRIVG